MVKLIILLRQGVRSSAHADSYNDFLMKLEALPGLRRKAVSSIYGASSGLSPYETIIEAAFDDHAALEAALTSPSGVEAGKTLLAFAAPDALILFADALEQSYP